MSEEIKYKKIHKPELRQIHIRAFSKAFPSGWLAAIVDCISLNINWIQKADLTALEFVDSVIKSLYAETRGIKASEEKVIEDALPTFRGSRLDYEFEVRPKIPIAGFVITPVAYIKKGPHKGNATQVEQSQAEGFQVLVYYEDENPDQAKTWLGDFQTRDDAKTVVKLLTMLMKHPNTLGK